MPLEIRDHPADAVDWVPDLVLDEETRVSSTQVIDGFTWDSGEDPDAADSEWAVTPPPDKSAWIKLVVPGLMQISVDAAPSDYATYVAIYNDTLTILYGDGTNGISGTLEPGTYLVQVLPVDASTLVGGEVLDLGVVASAYATLEVEVSLDAWVIVTSGSATLNAWVSGGRHRHHRARDHFGADSDLYVAIDEPVGKWGAGTPVKYVLVDLYDRITRLTSSDHAIRRARLDAVVLAPGTPLEVEPGTMRAVFPLDAVVRGTPSSSFTLRALVTLGGSGTATLDAYVKGTGRFYLNAFVA